jgi:hypothetical protein
MDAASPEERRGLPLAMGCASMMDGHGVLRTRDDSGDNGAWRCESGRFSAVAAVTAAP